MDWEGRDRDRAARRYRGGTVQFGKSPKKTGWLVIVLFWVAASLVTLKIVHYVQGSGMSVLMQKTREKLPDMKSFSTPVLPPDSTVKVDSQQVLRQPIERLASQMVDPGGKAKPLQRKCHDLSLQSLCRWRILEFGVLWYPASPYRSHCNSAGGHAI